MKKIYEKVATAVYRRMGQHIGEAMEAGLSAGGDDVLPEMLEFVAKGVGRGIQHMFDQAETDPRAGGMMVDEIDMADKLVNGMLPVGVKGDGKTNLSLKFGDGKGILSEVIITRDGGSGGKCLTKVVHAESWRIGVEEEKKSNRYH